MAVITFESRVGSVADLVLTGSTFRAAEAVKEAGRQTLTPESLAEDLPRILDQAARRIAFCVARWHACCRMPGSELLRMPPLEPCRCFPKRLPARV